MTIVYCFQVKVVIFLYKKVVAYVANVLFLLFTTWLFPTGHMFQWYFASQSAIKRAKIICYKSQLLTD